MRKRSFLAGLFLATTATLVAGCGSVSPLPVQGSPQSAQAPEAKHPLPVLTEAESLRDQAVRSEAAIEARLEGLSRLATDCTKCAADLDAAATSSAERLSLLGGLWSPWEDTSFPADEAGQWQQPPVVGDAPVTVGPLVGYMVATGTAQLFETAEATQVPEEERVALGSLLSARISSGYLLADAFNVQAAEEAALLPDSELATIALAEVPLAVEEPADEGDKALDATGSGVVASLDCVRSTVLAASSDSPADQLRLGSHLSQRARDLIGLGLPGNSSPKCRFPGADLDDAFRELLRVDLILFSSQSAEVRLIGAQALESDARAWAEMAAESAPTVTALPRTDLKEEDEDD